MSLFEDILGRDRRGRAFDAARARFVRAAYDAARDTPENRRHWANADYLSADALGDPETRRKLRARSRYEFDNNGFLKSIVLTLAAMEINAGPRLQMRTDDDGFNEQVERSFAEWCQAVDLPGKLRTMRQAKAVDGEAFALLIRNPTVEHQITLDVQTIEADQVATPNFGSDQDQPVDGIILDEYGNPRTYHVLERHPGSVLAGMDMDKRDVKAERIIHWFRQDRPGQHRGIPEMQASLPLCALLRRFTLATVSAAEAAALFTLLFETSSPETETEEPDQWSEIEINRNAGSFLPAGWKATQLRAEHPNAQFDAFERRILAEIARPALMPYNIAAGDSSAYNFASGRLDWQTFELMTQLGRQGCERAVMEKILRAWLPEYLLSGDSRRLSYLERLRWPVIYLWPSVRFSGDPLKSAKADQISVLGGLQTEADYWAARGADWQEKQDEMARERQRREKLGLPPLAPVAAAAEHWHLGEEVRDD